MPPIATLPAASTARPELLDVDLKVVPPRKVE
jgi:hypothetical protein